MKMTIIHFLNSLHLITMHNTLANLSHTFINAIAIGDRQTIRSRRNVKNEWCLENKCCFNCTRFHTTQSRGACVMYRTMPDAVQNQWIQWLERTAWGCHRIDCEWSARCFELCWRDLFNDNEIKPYTIYENF